MTNLKTAILSMLLPLSFCTMPASARGNDLPPSPLDFIESLKRYDNRLHTYIFRNKVKNWIAEEDIPELIKLLDSKEPCAGVMSEPSGYVPGKSTVGDQAAYMIDGFRNRIYPPSLHSETYDESEKQDLKNWWLVYQQAEDRARK